MTGTINAAGVGIVAAKRNCFVIDRVGTKPFKIESHEFIEILETVDVSSGNVGFQCVEHIAALGEFDISPSVILRLRVLDEHIQRFRQEMDKSRASKLSNTTSARENRLASA